MKTLFLILILVVFGCGQTVDTMFVDINIPAPQEVIDQIQTLECFYQEDAVASNIGLYTSMPLSEARALGGVLGSTYQGLQTNLELEVTANGNWFNFAVFGLDANGNEVVHQVGFINYHLRSGTCGIQQLPVGVINESVIIQVNVSF